VHHWSDRLSLPLDPDVPVERLSVGLRQRVEIVKALAVQPRILLLDEPTAVLAPAEVDELLQVVHRFTESGGAAVLITHNLDEALTAADRVTVLRRGTVVLEEMVAGLDNATLAEAMIGRSAAAVWDGSPAMAPEAGASPLIQIDALEVARDGGLGIAVKGASLVVGPGELVGIAAVEGNGQRELLRAVAGRLHPLRGQREVAEPIAFIPEDRTSEGLIPELSLTENVVLGSTQTDPWIRGGRIDWQEAGRMTASLLAEYAIAAPSPSAPAATLSGGNQQRVVVARELSRRPRVVIAENPTRGLDISATATIHARLRQAAADGAAILFHSSDLDEVLELATRVVVASRGVLIEPPSNATREVIGGLMLAGS
jgi:simple sugar transport system ATP-binding protein